MGSIKLGNTLSTLSTITALLLLSLGGCSRFLIENEPPEAKVQLLMNGAPVADLSMPIPFMGTPIVFTLDGSMSSDDDGKVVSYEWLDTDVPPNVRYDAGIMNLSSFTGDPQGASPQVTLGEGHYKFSLWVTDDQNTISAPATLEFTIETPTTFMPDMACASMYMSNVEGCMECVCTPPEMMGCLDKYKACYENADPQFVTLCKAVVDCARAMGCTGTGCYTAAFCMAQIDAAATYNGGTLADCSNAALATTSPCTAASQLGVCTTMGPCTESCD